MTLTRKNTMDFLIKVIYSLALFATILCSSSSYFLSQINAQEGGNSGFDEFGNPLAAIDNFTAAEQQQPLPPAESATDEFGNIIPTEPLISENITAIDNFTAAEQQQPLSPEEFVTDEFGNIIPTEPLISENVTPGTNQSTIGSGGEGEAGAPSGSSSGSMSAPATSGMSPTMCEPNAQVLRMGDNGELVVTLQNLLVERGYTPGPVDGDFGPGTQDAVTQFQSANGLAPDGIVGTNTWQALCPTTVPSPQQPSPPLSQQPVPSTPASGGKDISDAGLDFITRHEGLKTKLYNDPANHCTIGVGHLVHKGPCNGGEKAEFRDGLTQEEARLLLRSDANVAITAINRLVQVPLEQHQFDALVSFTFNVGTGAFEKSTLLKKLNEGNYDEIRAELGKWVKGGGKILPGLQVRRTAEANLFDTAAYR